MICISSHHQWSTFFSYNHVAIATTRCCIVKKRFLLHACCYGNNFIAVISCYKQTQLVAHNQLSTYKRFYLAKKATGYRIVAMATINNELTEWLYKSKTNFSLMVSDVCCHGYTRWLTPTTTKTTATKQDHHYGSMSAAMVLDRTSLLLW